MATNAAGVVSETRNVRIDALSPNPTSSPMMRHLIDQGQRPDPTNRAARQEKFLRNRANFTVANSTHGRTLRSANTAPSNPAGDVTTSGSEEGVVAQAHGMGATDENERSALLLLAIGKRPLPVTEPLPGEEAPAEEAAEAAAEEAPREAAQEAAEVAVAEEEDVEMTEDATAGDGLTQSQQLMDDGSEVLMKLSIPQERLSLPGDTVTGASIRTLTFEGGLPRLLDGKPVVVKKAKAAADACREAALLSMLEHKHVIGIGSACLCLFRTLSSVLGVAAVAPHPGC